MVGFDRQSSVVVRFTPFADDVDGRRSTFLDLFQSDGVDDRGQTLRNLSAEQRFSFCFQDEVERISARAAR